MRRVSALVMVALLLGPTVAAVVWNIDRRVAIGLATLTALAAVALLVERARLAVGDSGGDGGGEGDGWSLVPAWQYEGRHAESGGIARGEQERAIRDVEAQAERERGPD